MIMPLMLQTQYAYTSEIENKQDRHLIHRLKNSNYYFDELDPKECFTSTAIIMIQRLFSNHLAGGLWINQHTSSYHNQQNINKNTNK
jgi:hypothetical protein